MDTHRTRAAVLTGVAGWVPPGTVTNAELEARLDTTDEWIRSRTGIAERHIVPPGTATRELAVEAGKLALKSAGRDSVDAVVLATATPDRLCPATAPEVASALGLGPVAAHDVAAVCAGFLYALSAGVGAIAAGFAEHVLVIGAETFSTIVDPEDRNTAVIFGDAAGAVVLRAGDPDEPGAIGPIRLGSDGTHSDLIQIPAGGARQRSAGTAPGASDHHLQMQGRKVYRHAKERMTQSALEVLERSNWAVADVDRLATHQANARISEAVADELGIPHDRVLSNIERVGNTAAASLPLLLADSASEGKLRPRDRVLLAAFGGGLAWGAAALTWPDVTALAVHTYRG
ncbi:beta-ketoacyl-ACP synthase 3 [Streptomyces aurantiacus]|uniref:Beta-ketoacyl-[acyl-carrier-protein] synthase III n=1 Tax=Streptomyces aurantiacus JA 4570 TaxID=1286094 RepID=S3ZLI1_9ACTN|nr:beta-ketoacyl-ACP synthase 3 [Streptomyces aurantiacus]EPH44396.1 putative 3-oxoacyl-[acyl-carrier-protein] synthase 3 protein 3 [Streptomyces aurantiacus JA 4570]